MLSGGNLGGSGGALDHQVSDCLVHRDDLHLEPKVVQAYQDQDPWEHHCEDQQVVRWQQLVAVLLGLPACYHWNSIKTHKSID